MSEDDIYGSRERYELFMASLGEVIKKPTDKRAKYYCKNPENIKYFKKLGAHFDVKDLSYVRRLRVMHVLKFITFVIDKDLGVCDREDINKVVTHAHKTHKTPNSKRDIIKDLKCIWRILFPEKDSQSKVDETLTPYAVRHLSRKVDKSKEKLRNDRLTPEEFYKILTYFSKEPKMQAYLMLALESLGRPQEILFTKIRDYEFHDNFAKVWISEHGKEGCGFLQCIDSYPYVIEWYNKHPLKSACKALGINKSITCYSLKRNGVTFRRLRGDSDTEIQHAARWTSTKQLQIYDMSTQQDAFNMELRKRGKLIENEKESIDSSVKVCTFCSLMNQTVDEAKFVNADYGVCSRCVSLSEGKFGIALLAHIVKCLALMMKLVLQILR